MFDIAQYLEKFDSLLRSSSAIKKDIVGEIKESVGIELNPQDIDVRGTTLFINTSPLLKNEIYFKKNLILQTLQKNLRGQKITEIR